MLRGLSPYRVLRPLGEGGEADVFLAIDSRANRRVCIKLYRYQGGIRERQRLEREAWRLASLDTPHLAELLDVVAHGGRLALVTRFVPGCGLAQLLRVHGRLAPGAALALLSDIASALAALRRMQLVHGDLSPANVLVNEYGRAVLIDLGVSVLAGGRTAAVSDSACTPEQLRGQPVDLRSDFFALGLLLHRMLTGEHPFLRNGILDRTALQRGLREAPSLPVVGEPTRRALQDLLATLLAAAPAKRPEDTIELRERLRDLRAAVPPDHRLGALALAAARQAPVAGPCKPLPRQLIRLPWTRKAQAAVAAYWRHGSAGARVLLIALVLLVPGAAYLLHAQPGPCIAIGPVSRGVGAARLLAAGNRLALRAQLTGFVKSQAPAVTVLGRGDVSDSRPLLSRRGLRDICVPQRSLGAKLSCDEVSCRLELIGRHVLDRHRTERDVAPVISQRDFRNVLRAMVAEQLDLLRI